MSVSPAVSPRKYTLDAAVTAVKSAVTMTKTTTAKTAVATANNTTNTTHIPKISTTAATATTLGCEKDVDAHKNDTSSNSEKKQSSVHSLISRFQKK